MEIKYELGETKKLWKIAVEKMSKYFVTREIVAGIWVLIKCECVKIREKGSSKKYAEKKWYSVRNIKVLNSKKVGKTESV